MKCRLVLQIASRRPKMKEGTNPIGIVPSFLEVRGGVEPPWLVLQTRD